MLTLKEFIDKVNLPEFQTGEHNFYMVNDDVKYVIEPVYNWSGYVDEIELED